MIDRSRWLRTSALAALFLPLLAPSQASAGLIIQIEPAITAADPDSAGNIFQVNLVNTDSTTYQISGFNVTVTTPSGSGITLDGADTSTTQPYIYSTTQPYNNTGNSVFFTFGNPSGVNSGDISDNAADLIGAIAGNTTYGLGRIYFSVDSATAAGLYSVTIDTVNSSLTGDGPNFDPIPFSTNDGQIRVRSVPEPSTIALVAMGLPAAFLFVRRRRGR